MSKLSSPKNAIVAGVLAVLLVVGAFWVLAISPKREEVNKLEAQVEQVKGSLAQHQAEIATAEQARQDFPAEYERLVVLGKAVPGGDETASLLVQLNHIAGKADVRFSTLTLSSAGGGESGKSSESSTPPASSSGEPVSPTEVAAATLPLGASVGPAGLAVMPYELDFTGGFFHIADFIEGLDKLVETESEKVTVDGRLMTINGFSLQAAPKGGFPTLEATFSVTTYLMPPGQGLTAGATPESPAGASEATPASTTTGAVAR